jgi:hypothetical protein
MGGEGSGPRPKGGATTTKRSRDAPRQPRASSAEGEVKAESPQQAVLPEEGHVRPEMVRVVADSVGVNMSSDVGQLLAPDVEYRLREIIQVGTLALALQGYRGVWRVIQGGHPIVAGWPLRAAAAARPSRNGTLTRVLALSHTLECLCVGWTGGLLALRGCSIQGGRLQFDPSPTRSAICYRGGTGRYGEATVYAVMNPNLHTMGTSNAVVLRVGCRGWAHLVSTAWERARSRHGRCVHGIHR